MKKIEFKHVKPYLYAIIIFAIPFLLVPVIKTAKENFFTSARDITSVDSTKKIDKEYVIVIHAGAGNYSKKDISETMEIKYKAKLLEALDTGIYILKNDGHALDAVERVIKILEDSPLFNAGKGAVFTHNGKNELDASIMDGKTLNAGAVAEVSNIKNPISAARKVMTNSLHVMLVGKGASVFAKQQKIKIVDTSYFFTQKRWEYLQKQIKKNKISKHGTVGCVVLDKFGDLAAGTSTGGISNKQYGRVGDSPIIGAGTYADNKTCAVSATGHGEYFIRYVVAYDISALMKYKGMTLYNAANYVIKDKLVKAGGDGGVIAVDKNGNIAVCYNTTGMFRAYAKSNGDEKVALY